MYKRVNCHLLITDDTRSSDGQASTITTSADKESVKNVEKEEFHSGVTGQFTHTSLLLLLHLTCTPLQARLMSVMRS